MGEVAKFLNREELLKGTVFRTREIDIGERKLRIREPSAAEYLAFIREEQETSEEVGVGDDATAEAKAVAMVKSLEANNDRTAKLIVKLAIGEDGQRLFQDDDVEVVRQAFGASVLLDVYRTIIRTIREDQAFVGEPSAPTAR